MSAPGKIKGSNFEREVVAELRVRGIPSKRAYASNGNALGEHEQVDIVVYHGRITNNPDTKPTVKLKLQLKRRKKLPEYLGMTKHVDAVVFRQDNDVAYILLPLATFIDHYLIEDK